MPLKINSSKKSWSKLHFFFFYPSRILYQKNWSGYGNFRNRWPSFFGVVVDESLVNVGVSYGWVISRQTEPPGIPCSSYRVKTWFWTLTLKIMRSTIIHNKKISFLVGRVCFFFSIENCLKKRKIINFFVQEFIDVTCYVTVTTFP